MKNRDVIIKAVEEQNGKLAVQICDHLRSKGCRYAFIYKMVNGIIPISEADWDALLYEGES